MGTDERLLRLGEATTWTPACENGNIGHIEGLDKPAPIVKAQRRSSGAGTKSDPSRAHYGHGASAPFGYRSPAHELQVGWPSMGEHLHSVDLVARGNEAAGSGNDVLKMGESLIHRGAGDVIPVDRLLIARHNRCFCGMRLFLDRLPRTM